MSGGEAALPVTYSWWVPVLGAFLLLLAIAWVIVVLRRRKDRAQERRDARAPGLRLSYRERVDALHERFRRGEIDLRTFHLELAEMVRDFGSERMGQDLSAMSRREVETAYPRTGLGVLLARCEQPSFSRTSAAEAATSVEMAHEVIARW